MFWDRLSELFVRQRRALTLGVLFMTALAIAGLVPPLGPIRFDDRPHLIFKTDGDEYALLQQLDEDFGSDDADCYLLVEAQEHPHLFTPVAAEGLQHIVRQIEDLKIPIKGQMVPAVEENGVRSMVEIEVVRGRGLSRTQRPLLPKKGAPAEDFERARQDALAHDLVAGPLLSEDARSTLIVARLNPKFEQVSQFGLAVDEFSKLSTEVFDAYGLRMRATGVPPIRVEIYRSIVYETVKFTLIAIALAGVMGFVIFRRFSLVVITCVGPWAGALWTLGLMGLVGEPLNIINVVLPTLVVVVGFTNAIHLVVDMRESLAAGKTPVQAAAGAVRLIGGACGLAALTTAVGFSSLATSQSEIIQRFGLVCGGGALVAFVAVVTTVPLLASVLLRSQERIAGSQNPPPPRAGLIGRAIDRLIDRVLGRRCAVAAIGMAVTAGLALTALSLHADTMLTDTIPKHREAAETLNRVDEVFGGAIVAIVHLEWDEKQEVDHVRIVSALLDVENVVNDYEDLHHPVSTLNLLRSMPGGQKRPHLMWEEMGIFPPEVRERFLNTDRRRAIVVARIENTGAASHEPVYQSIEGHLADLEQKHPGFTMRLTGMPVVAARSIHRMIYDLAISLSLAGVVIFGVILITFRSPKLGAISIIPNMFPLVCTSAVLVFSGRPLQLTTVIVFTICLGIAVDDTIHLINRFRREYLESGSVEAALRRSTHAVGTALVTSTIVLLVGFGSMLFAEVPATLLFAWFTSIGIASALIGDLVILPAMLAWFVKDTPRVPQQSPDGPQSSATYGDEITFGRPHHAAPRLRLSPPRNQGP